MSRAILTGPRRRCGCGEIGIRGGLKIHWGFPRCRFESDQPHHSFRSPRFQNVSPTLNVVGRNVRENL